MLIPETIEDLQFLRETNTVECKLAVGKDGQGKLPTDFWPTYSAFANSYGGVVLLGVKEKTDGFEFVGIRDVEKVRKELFTGLNNRKQVSVNLLSDSSVSELDVDGVTIIKIEVPRATRTQKPVHLTPNPFEGNTYKRLNESDVSLSDAGVKHLLAEQVEDSRDNRVLSNFDFSDLSAETFASYRQVFANRLPDHPYNPMTNMDFLHAIGGWRRDRETGSSGLTVAGLLMFGTAQSIQDEFPNYILDYQERPEAKTEKRWVDRLTLDGTWSGNLYDFYRRVYLKLTTDLKVPFVLEGVERQDETEIHVSIREALANTIVHADYSGRASVLVVKRPDMFGFRNPGLMRIPVDVALRGGEHDCRNRMLHQMFRFVGVGEQAGSGIPKIFQGWKAQHWNPPKLHEISEPYDQTLLELRMIDIFPEKTVADLRSKFGERFDQLSHAGQVALALASSEGAFNHPRLCMLSTEHTSDLSRLLHNLVQDGFLMTSGTGRGVVYYLADQEMPSPDDVFSLPSPPQTLGAGGPNIRTSAPNVRSSSLHMDDANPTSYRDEKGYLHVDQLKHPIIDTLEELADELRQHLEELADEPRTKGKLDRTIMESTILRICEGHYITLQALAALVNRSPDALRNQYLSPMVKSDKLNLAFPQSPTHEKQAYCTATTTAD